MKHGRDFKQTRFLAGIFARLAQGKVAECRRPAVRKAPPPLVTVATQAKLYILTHPCRPHILLHWASWLSIVSLMMNHANSHVPSRVKDVGEYYIHFILTNA